MILLDFKTILATLIERAEELACHDLRRRRIDCDFTTEINNDGIMVICFSDKGQDSIHYAWEELWSEPRTEEL